jgi:hypothetical protein
MIPTNGPTVMEHAPPDEPQGFRMVEAVVFAEA